MKNNKKKTRMTKTEKRRLAFEKRNVKKEQNLARYGAEGGYALVMAKTTAFNRRFVAAFLALVFVLTSVVVGYNFMARANDEEYKMFSNIDDSGFVTRKGLKDNGDGTYSIRMEAYATKPLASKAVKSNTPLDVILVMDQSTSMNTKDILTREENAYQAVDATSFTIQDILNHSETEDYKYYYRDGNDYYPVLIESRDDNNTAAYVKVKENGSIKQSWTAQQAQDVKNNQSDQRNLYYKNGDIFETVIPKKVAWYKNAGELKPDEILDAGFLPSLSNISYQTNNQNIIEEFFYNSSADDVDTTSIDYYRSWHKVYFNTTGVVTPPGYYIDGWYYTGSETGNAVPSSTNPGGYSNAYTQALRNNIIARIQPPAYHQGGLLGHGDYEAFYSTTGLGSNKNYNKGKLYTKEPANDVYNELTTSNGTLLAWPLAQGNSDSNTNPGSSTYEGELWTPGYIPYYEKDDVKHYIGTSTFSEDEASYIVSNQNDIPLYEKETITRLEASKLAATQLAEQIARTASEDVDHRIAVVGFNDSGTNLVPAKDNDADPDNDLNDIVDSKLAGLTASGGTITSGLNNAQSVFANNIYKADENRKRIVVVFTDDDTADSNALNVAAALKDTYNATVYTVGVYSSNPNEAVDTFMSHLSSEYFATATNPIAETDNVDGVVYYRKGTDKPTILSAATNVATATQSSTTTTTLGATSVLKDIISSNFNVPNKPGATEPDITIETATSSFVNEEISWESEGSIDDTTDMLAWDENTQTLSVSGFDYNANFVNYDSEDEAQHHSGKKIIVTIKGLTLKDSISTDSDRRIYSNEPASGIYKKGAEETLFAAFPRPFVDKTSNLVPNGSSGVPNDNNTVLNKYLTANENGNYDLTLEAYSTSNNVAVATTEKIPTDFVVVVDQSGSMDERDMPTGTATLRNNVNLETVATDNQYGGYYYYDEATGEYYKVYGVKDYLYQYYPANTWFTGDIVEHLGADIGWFMSETDATTNIDNAFYFREVVDGKTYYQPIKTTIEGKIGTYYMRFSYPSKQTGRTYDFNRDVTAYSSNNKSPWYKNVVNGDVMSSGALWSAANFAVQGIYPDNYAYTFSTLDLGLIKPRTGMYINYPMYGRHLAYTKLCYRDVNGVEHVLPSNQNDGQTTWEFCNKNGQAITTQSGTTRPTYNNLYTFDEKIRRIEALQAALGTFAEKVANETDSFGHVDNTIAIVGFSSDGFNNNELLTNTTEGFAVNHNASWANYSSSSHYSSNGKAHDGIQNSVADNNTSYYTNALVPAYSSSTDNKVDPRITDGIAGITAHGGTQPETGLDMAYKILSGRSSEKTTYKIRSPGEHYAEIRNRNTAVIFFTDGQPGDYHISNQYKEANDVIEKAKIIKDYNNTSIFSIGVFSESDGNPLTYADTTQDQSKRASWKYLGGWLETYQESGNYYCIRRQWRPGNDDYTEIANDTIYDYMSVTSSNYPDAKEFIAPAWLNGNFNGSYKEATEGDSVRQKSSAERTNKYYRMASSQDTLIEAFLQALTMNSEIIEGDGTLGASTILRDILESDNFKMTDTTSVTLETAKGKADANGVVTFEKDKEDAPPEVTRFLGSDSVDVTGFDYTVNSIFYGKSADEEHDLEANQGRKLIVTLTNLVPKETKTSDSQDPLLYSNDDGSGLIKENALYSAFPEPAITRHSYTMDVGDANKNAAFEVTTKLVANDGASADLSDVILVDPDGNRVPYTEVEEKVFNMTDGKTFYFENVPSDYYVKTSLKAPDSFYEYSFWINNETEKKTLSTKDATSRTLDYSDNVLHVSSESRYRTVTIAESVSGEYANTKDVFSVNLTLTPPDGDPFDEEQIALADDVVLERKANGTYQRQLDGLPGNQNEKELKVPTGWTLRVDPIDHERYDVENGYPKYNTNEDATINPMTNNSVVISKDLTNIFINNISKPITVEGVLDSGNHNWIIYILAALGGLAAIGGGIFLWKKKDEFIEQ